LNRLAPGLVECFSAVHGLSHGYFTLVSFYFMIYLHIEFKCDIVFGPLIANGYDLLLTTPLQSNVFNYIYSIQLAPVCCANAIRHEN